MLPKDARRERVLPVLDALGEVSREAFAKVSKETGVPEADVFGTVSFYRLLDPRKPTRVCQGLTCALAGSDALIEKLRAEGKTVEPYSCLGQCDRAPAWLDGDLKVHAERPRGRVLPDDSELPMNLGGTDSTNYAALKKVTEVGPEAVLDALDASGLQGRGGAGFPAGRKWRSVRSQPDTTRYVVCNADEAEPGTFKDRELMLRRPHLLLEGLAIAARIAEAQTIYIYIRGEYGDCIHAVEQALEEVKDHVLLKGLEWKIVHGHGAYICGEEMALLESIEGKRGMPRLKPPYPTEVGLFGKPTLINNVETLACVPSIVLRGGEWFKGLGKTQAGTKLYSISGHVAEPGVYELPIGVTLDELVEAAGGYVGTPAAFSPGGASSGFLPISKRDVPLDFKALYEAGSMLGSAGVVVLDDSVDMALAAHNQAVFFEDESCGQCAPCRIGARMLKRSLDRYLESGDPAALELTDDIAWEMEEGSICGLGYTAPLPLKTAREHFPQAFAARGDA